MSRRKCSWLFAINAIRIKLRCTNIRINRWNVEMINWYITFTHVHKYFRSCSLRRIFLGFYFPPKYCKKRSKKKWKRKYSLLLPITPLGKLYSLYLQFICWFYPAFSIGFRFATFSGLPLHFTVIPGDAE